MTRRTMTSPRRISRTVGAAVAAAALVALTACGGETPQVPNLPDNLPQVPGVGDPRQAFGDAHQKALGLAALGGIGLEQGVGNTVKELAPQVQGEGQQLNDKLRGLASAIGVSLPDQVSPEIQAQVDDLKARTGEQFDQGWLQAAQAQVGALSDQTQQLLNVPGLPPEQLDQARAQLTNLGELKTKLDQAAAEAGATTPGSGSGNADGNGSGADGNAAGNGTAPGNGSGNGAGDGPASGSGSPAVDAGTGGQAASASDVALPVALGGAGLLLLVAGAVRLRRARA
ncbi:MULTISPECIES: DUF4142 domain-containing protein [unclassified Pseudonocardia]|uniref:DUF4142 domain-containing protein n=1 Tax=unclassified Pseudonocardia TaxID=2619320 RepID=UPI000967FE8E|nr:MULTISPECIES: DUF4142 domain-containing protein [unclassified Pseudonocardia]OLM29800.1 hypothetical protein Ae717Ps2_0693 [Pseudonocardia sp. Ae717_Ps2]